MASHGTPFRRMSVRFAWRNLMTGGLVSVGGGGGGGAVTTDTDVAPLLVLPAASAQLTPLTLHDGGLVTSSVADTVTVTLTRLSSAGEIDEGDADTDEMCGAVVSVPTVTPTLACPTLLAASVQMPVNV